MSMIFGKINLRQFKHALMTTPKGTKAIVIPIKENNLFEGEKGLYFDFVAFDRKEVSDTGDTHLLKQSFDKKTREAMSEQEKKDQPIFGNIQAGERSKSEPEPKGSDEVAKGADDLPF